VLTGLIRGSGVLNGARCGFAVDGEGVRQAKTGHFPTMLEAKVADSAVLDSDDDDSYGCTRLAPPQGHFSSSASQREGSAESAQQR